MSIEAINSVFDVVRQGRANVPGSGEMLTRTFANGTLAVTLTITDIGIVASNGDDLLGLYSEGTLEYKEAYRAIKSVRVAPGILDDLLAQRPVKLISKTEFMQLFTPDEYKAFLIEKAKPLTEQLAFIAMWLDISQGLENIDLVHPGTDSFLNGLVEIGIITVERKAEILSSTKANPD